MTAKVTVYSKPSCGGCMATKRALDSAKIDYVEIDVTKDEDAYNFVTQTLNYNQMPVVVTEKEHWSGFNLDKIKAI